MKVLVTGAAGFIGSSLTDRLLAEGASVTGFDCFNDFYPLDRKEKNLAAALKNSRFQLVRADLNESGALDAVFDQNRFDTVVHLAARAGVRPSLADPSAYCRDNISATVALLDAMRRHNVRKLVFASSSSVYGNRSETLFSEDLDVTRPISPYAATKSACEQLCYTWHRLYKMSIVMLRFFTVYGPRQRPDLAIAKFCRKILNREPIPVYGDGKTMRDYTFIDDILDGVAAAISYDQTPFEIVNLGGGQPIRLAEMIEIIEETLGIKAQIDRQPMQPGDVEKTAADIRKAQKLFGYRPRTAFREGIQKYAEWLRAGE